MVTDKEEPKVYTAEQASQGFTVLRSPLRKLIFFGGLALLAVVVVALALYGGRRG